MNLMDYFKRGTSVMRLVYINIGVFVIVKFLMVFFVLFNVRPSVALSYLYLPSSLDLLVYRPWTFFTYMFCHGGFFHLFFNMMCLYWFGKIALDYFSQRQIVGLYVMGGVFGGLTYILAYNLIPYFTAAVSVSSLVGASASVLAIACAVVTVNPDYPIRLLFVGEIKMLWLVVGMVALSFLSLTGENAGGEFAHVGGALAGWLFGLAWKWRLTGSFGDWCRRVFAPRPKIKVTKGRRDYGERPQTDAEYNRERRENNEVIDAILDKIRQRGYESLTSEEKRELFDRSRKSQ